MHEGMRNKGKRYGGLEDGEICAIVWKRNGNVERVLKNQNEKFMG